MRIELTILEKINEYLAGNLHASERLDFENLLDNDESLRAQVEAQKEFIRAINRKVLRSQIQSVAAGGAGGIGMTQWLLGIGGLVVITGLIAGFFYYNQADETSEMASNISDTDSIESIEINLFRAINPDEDGLILEERETIFSSQKNYDDVQLDEDDINVTVHFRSRGEGLKVDSSVYRNANSGVVEIQKDVLSTLYRAESDNTTYRNHARKASYPGGNGALKKFIDKNLSYPQSARDKSIECVVRCEFHVTEDGLISEIRAECIKMAEKDGVAFTDMKVLMNKKIMNSFIGNATHILRTMPIWEPARNSQGSPVLSIQRMYFNYDLERGCLVYQLDEDVPTVQVD